MKVKEIMEKEIDPKISQSYYCYSKGKQFRAKYAQMKTEDVDWIEICKDAHQYNYCKYALLLMVQLLKSGLYCGSYSERLYHNLPIYLRLFEEKSQVSREILCGEKVEKQILCFYGDAQHELLLYRAFIDTNNTFILNLVEEYLCALKKKNFAYLKGIPENFGKSLGINESLIHSSNDFTSSMMFDQVNFFKRLFKDDQVRRSAALKFIVNFYRWLVQNNPEHDYFENDLQMSEALLFNYRLNILLENDYYFTTLNPLNIPYDKERICFLLKGLENLSTGFTNDDYVSIDFSSLTCSFYRNLLIEFMLTSPISIFRSLGIPAAIVAVMEKLYQIKQEPSYPNKRIDHLSNEEAVFIRQFFSAQEIKLGTKNQKIGAVKRFLKYCQNKEEITVDNLFFDYLRQYEEPNKNTARTVPDEDLTKLNQYFLEKSKDDLVYKEMYVIFHLAIQTEFRISQICHLEIDCIHPTVKPNQFEILSNSKTSHGKKDRYIISSITYNLLMDIIEATETIRENCPVDSMKQYIFLYNQSGLNNKPTIFNSRIFSGRMKKACEELKIEKYTAANLRDTHMTKSLEHIMRNGKSDMEMSVLSKHRYLDTTKNHYIEMELEKMLEATYGITIGTELIETNSKVVDKIPESLQGCENDVEYGCGKCTAESCVMTGSLPCMACKHFITTINHEIYFKKAIENIERLISVTTNAHDKEDLITIKTLYVLYLKAINLHKEGIVND